MKPEREDRGREMRQTAMLSTVGLTLALSIGIGIGLGVLADRYWKTNGVAVVIGTLVGIAAGFRELLRAVLKSARDQEREDARKSDEQDRPARDE
jgi:F0F1-type ATP synthase assembly protein I